MQALYFSMRNKNEQLVSIHLFGNPECLSTRLKAQGYTDVKCAQMVFGG